MSKKIVLGSLLLVMALAGGCNEGQGRSHKHQVAQSLCAWKAQGGESSGLIALIRGGDVEYAESLGFSDRDAKVPFTITTRFLVASITKQMTAAALLRALEEQGRDLDASMQLSILHFLPKEDPLWQGEVPAWAEKVTLHQLLTHSSGLVDLVYVPNILQKAATFKGPEEVLRTAIYLPLHFEPGTSVEYCNTGYHLAGLVIERLSGVSFREFLQTRFFDPIGMQNSSVGNPAGEFFAKAYFKDRETGEYRLAESYPLDLCWASGGVISTAQDLAKWNQWLYQSSYIERMTRPHVTMPLAMQRSWGAESYGYGLALTKQGDRTLLWHGGHLPGLRHRLTYLPDEQLTVLIARNVIFDPSQKKESAEHGLDFSQSVLEALR